MMFASLSSLSSQQGPVSLLATLLEKFASFLEKQTCFDRAAQGLDHHETFSLHPSFGQGHISLLTSLMKKLLASLVKKRPGYQRTVHVFEYQDTLASVYFFGNPIKKNKIILQKGQIIKNVTC